MGRWGHEAAVAAGARLVSVSRPGYGGSTTLRTASLLAVGRDTAALATHLGFDRYAVFGCSGGGPFAVATAIADPAALEPSVWWEASARGASSTSPRPSPRNASVLALLDAGDLGGAWEGSRGQWEEEFGGFATPDDAVDDIIAGDAAAFASDEHYRALWRENMRLVLADVDGGVRDNLAWGGAWDVDLRDVVAPTVLWFGEDDDRCPLSHGRWYADRIAGSELIVLPTGGHIDSGRRPLARGARSSPAARPLTFDGPILL